MEPIRRRGFLKVVPAAAAAVIASQEFKPARAEATGETLQITASTASELVRRLENLPTSGPELIIQLNEGTFDFRDPGFNRTITFVNPNVKGGELFESEAGLIIPGWNKVQFRGRGAEKTKLVFGNQKNGICFNSVDTDIAGVGISREGQSNKPWDESKEKTGERASIWVQSPQRIGSSLRVSGCQIVDGIPAIPGDKPSGVISVNVADVGVEKTEILEPVWNGVVAYNADNLRVLGSAIKRVNPDRLPFAGACVAIVNNDISRPGEIEIPRKRMEILGCKTQGFVKHFGIFNYLGGSMSIEDTSVEGQEKYRNGGWLIGCSEGYVTVVNVKMARAGSNQLFYVSPNSAQIVDSDFIVERGFEWMRPPTDAIPIDSKIMVRNSSVTFINGNALPGEREYLQRSGFLIKP